MTPANPRPTWWAALKLAGRAARVRLRFVAILLVASLVVGQWDALVNRSETLARRWLGAAWVPELQPVSTDTEYFCPMDPGVLSDWPGQCGVCNMALVRRKKGEATPRPDGVIARMQFTPYRVQLAGLRTAPAEYRDLATEARGVGQVVGREGTVARVRATFFERDRPALEVGQAVAVSSDSLPAGAPALDGKLDRFPDSTAAEVEVAVPDPENLLKPGTPVTAVAHRPVADSEPFRSVPVGPPAPRKGELRTLYACPDHPATPRAAPGLCPADRKPLEPYALGDAQRVGWWCPAHPGTVADAPGATCAACGGMSLEPRVVNYRPAGRVLAVPESSVVDTGARTLVYVERMPGTFDAVEVKLGPRCGGYYPVASGLEPGERVATSGAFLVDAETRIDPALAASYFGATGGKGPTPTRAEPPPALGALSPEDRALADRQQGLCPVTRKPLGSMGAPVRVEVAGRSVLLCCAGCEGRLRKDPGRYRVGPP